MSNISQLADRAEEGVSRNGAVSVTSATPGTGSASHCETFRRNETIYFEGQAATSLYRVDDGIVRIVKYTYDGRRQIIDFKFPGSWFGVHCDGQGRHRFTAQAAAPTSLVRYPCDRRHNGGPAAGERPHEIATTVERDLASAYDLCVLLGAMKVTERVAWFLLWFAKNQAVMSNDTNEIELTVRRGDIADYLGIAPETLSRVLSELVAEKIIFFPEARKVVVLQEARLRSLANGGESF